MLRAPRLALHAWRLEFQHPISAELLRIEAALPAELLLLRDAAAVFQRAKKPRKRERGS
jgi:hypothetical protein